MTLIKLDKNFFLRFALKKLHVSYKKAVCDHSEFSLGIFFKNFDLNKKFKNKIEINNEKHAFSSAIQFPTISILRATVSTETIRQQGSKMLANFQMTYRSHYKIPKILFGRQKFVMVKKWSHYHFNFSTYVTFRHCMS